MKALLIVDMQNDFMPSGSLGVEGAHHLVEYINGLVDTFDLVVATQDYHPEGHSSFGQGGWPVHCVQGSHGAEFVSGLNCDRFDYVVQKGLNPEIDSYSAFFDNAKQHKTPLDAYLKEKGVDEIYVVGVATDYCVKFTVLDALELGYSVEVDLKAVRGVELQLGDVERAIEEMVSAGGKIAVEV